MNDVAAKRGINCLMDGDVVGAINMQKVIRPQLHKIAVAAKCSDSNIRPFMTETEVIQFVYNNYGIQVVVVVVFKAKKNGFHWHCFRIMKKSENNCTILRF